MKLGILFNGVVAVGFGSADRGISFVLRLRVDAGRLPLVGAAWVTSANFLRGRRGWLLFAIPMSRRRMARL